MLKLVLSIRCSKSIKRGICTAMLYDSSIYDSINVDSEDFYNFICWGDSDEFTLMCSSHNKL